MKMNHIVLLLIIQIAFSCQQKTIEKPIYTAEKWENPEWENPEIFQINREQPTASFYKYLNKDAALKNDSWRLLLPLSIKRSRFTGTYKPRFSM